MKHLLQRLVRALTKSISERNEPQIGRLDWSTGKVSWE